MKKYIIKPRKNFEFIEEYEKKSQNVIEIEALDYENAKIFNISKYNIYLSKDAILGLGTELIRMYMDLDKTYEVHLPTANKDYIVEELGVCNSPNSSDITFVKRNMNINKLLEENVQNNEIVIDKIRSLDKTEYNKVKEFLDNKAISYGKYTLKDCSILKVDSRNLIVEMSKTQCRSLVFKLDIEEFHNYYK